MDFFTERAIAEALKQLFGDDWIKLSKFRRVAYIEMIEYYASILTSKQMGGNATFVQKDFIGVVRERLAAIEKMELQSLLQNRYEDFYDIGMNQIDIYRKSFDKRRQDMVEILKKLEDLKLDKKVLEKRRLDIVDAINTRNSIPCDSLDLYVMEMVGLEMLTKEEREKISEWLKTEE